MGGVPNVLVLCIFLCQEAADVVSRRYTVIVAYNHFMGARIPFGIHNAFHALCLGDNLVMRVVTGYLDNTGLHV